MQTRNHISFHHSSRFAVSKQIKSTMRILILLFIGIAFLLEFGAIHSHVAGVLKDASSELSKRGLGGIQKRGFHEESPSFFVSDDNLLDLYSLPPYYPTRKYVFLFLHWFN